MENLDNVQKCLSGLRTTFGESLEVFGKLSKKSSLVRNISNTSDSISLGYPNTKKRVENMTRSGVFLTKIEVFG